MRAHDVSKCKMFQDSLKPQYLSIYLCMYVCVQKKNLNGYFWAILLRETWAKDSSPTLDGTLSLIRAIGASCTRQFSVFLLMHII